MKHQDNLKTPADIAATIERDALTFLFDVWDAENAEDASVELWERAIADFASHERVKLDSFRYSCDRPPKLLRKQWLDTGRNWPYCFAQLRKHDAWLPLGGNYKPLGEPQWRARGTSTTSSLTPHGVSLTIPAHLTAFGGGGARTDCGSTATIRLVVATTPCPRRPVDRIDGWAARNAASTNRRGRRPAA